MRIDTFSLRGRKHAVGHVANAFRYSGPENVCRGRLAVCSFERSSRLMRGSDRDVGESRSGAACIALMMNAKWVVWPCSSQTLVMVECINTGRDTGYAMRASSI